MVTRTCSLTVNGPGLSECPKILMSGRIRARPQPNGRETNWPTRLVIVTDGYRKKLEGRNNERQDRDGEERERGCLESNGRNKWAYKNWLRPGMMIAMIIPRNQTRMVEQGISGSSVFATAERTSGYGESSSTSPIWVPSRLGSSKWASVTFSFKRSGYYHSSRWVSYRLMIEEMTLVPTIDMTPFYVVLLVLQRAGWAPWFVTGHLATGALLKLGEIGRGVTGRRREGGWMKYESRWTIDGITIAITLIQRIDGYLIHR